jgi:succinate dehydrogenase cytochrome b subunit
VSASAPPSAAALPATGAPDRRGWVARLYGSVIGKKIAMALTGIILVGFVTVHMSGNLLAYRGATALDHYAEFLQSNALLLWTVRAVLLVSVVIHVHAALALTRRAALARPNRYATRRSQTSTLAAKLMRVGGVLLVVFIVFHILHFTTGTILPAEFASGDVYGNVVRSFSITWVALFYVVTMLALGLHLQHGIWSLFQTLGANHPHVNGARRGLAWLLSIVIPIGFAAVPLGVLFGVLR